MGRIVDSIGGYVLTIRNFAVLTVLGSVLAATGCTNPWMPVAGPESWDVRSQAVDVTLSGNRLPYALVNLDPRVLALLANNTPGFSGTFVDRRSPLQIKFGVGDTVSVTIFEAAAGGLFIPAEAGVRPGNFVQLPNQNIDVKGNITVPYAGSVRAVDRSPEEVQLSIVNALKNRAIEPQVVVALVTQNTSLMSVLGEVNQPARFPVSYAGEKILDSITRAGGPKGQGYDTWVMLERNGKRATVPFGALVYDPKNNIFSRPNDTIYLYREPQTFVAFGASGHQGQFNFEAWRISLAEAMAKAGGLNDFLADPASVFVYRGAGREFAAALGIDVSKFDGPVIPVVYNVNFRDPAGYFLATKFEMRNKDVVFASNSSAVEQAKVMNYIRLVTATVNDPIVAATNVYVLKAAINGTASSPGISTFPSGVVAGP
jgi:polysaccharide biosynthesis/export protein